MPGFVCLVDRMTERLGVSAQRSDFGKGTQNAARWYGEQGLL